MGFKKAEDFYLALGSGKLQVSQVANKVLHRLKTDEAVEEEALPRKPKAREAVASGNFGIHVPGVEDVLVRMAKCCTPVPGDEHRRLHLARQGHHHPPPRLPEREGADAEPRAVHARRVGRRRLAELPRPDRRRLLGPPAPARGRRAHLRRARHEHRRVRRARRGSDGEELVRRRGGRHQGAACAPRLACATSSRSSTRTASRPPGRGRRAPRPAPRPRTGGRGGRRWSSRRWTSSPLA